MNAQDFLCKVAELTTPALRATPPFQGGENMKESTENANNRFDFAVSVGHRHTVHS